MFMSCACLKQSEHNVYYNTERRVDGWLLDLWTGANFFPLTNQTYVFNKTGNVRINVTLRCVRVATVAVEKQ